MLFNFWKKVAFLFSNPACYLSSAQQRCIIQDWNVIPAFISALCAGLIVVIQIFLCIDKIHGRILGDFRRFRDRQTWYRQTHFGCFAALCISRCEKRNICWRSNYSTVVKNHTYFIACSVLLLPLVWLSRELVIWVYRNIQYKFSTMNAHQSSKHSQPFSSSCLRLSCS